MDTTTATATATYRAHRAYHRGRPRTMFAGTVTNRVTGAVVADCHHSHADTGSARVCARRTIRTLPTR
jgi:hypothetical protein